MHAVKSLFQSLIFLTLKASLSNAFTITPALEHSYHYYVATRKSRQLQIGGSTNALHVGLFFPLFVYMYIRRFIIFIPITNPIYIWL